MSRNRPLPVPLEEIPCAVLPQRMEPPFQWTSVFGREGPVELEVGCGKGLFLLEASRLRPDSNFIGVERAGKWFHRAVERCHRAERPNVRVVQWDAFDLLARWIPAGSVAAVHVYFPDPWPKARHARRRLLQPHLYALTARVLASRGAFLVASDVGPYLEEAVQEITDCGLFHAVPWPEDAPDRLPTNYALKYAKQGRSLYYARFGRTGG